VADVGFGEVVFGNELFLGVCDLWYGMKKSGMKGDGKRSYTEIP
jgi:hypothetical protein